jgi:predicted peptidase
MNRSILFVLSVLLFNACSADDDSIPTELTNGPPEWIDSYPIVAAGAVSVDLNLRTDRPGNIYYILSNQPLNLSAYEIIKKSKAPDLPSIKGSGVVQITTDSEISQTLDNLFQDSHYYAYLVAQNINDSLYLEQPQVREFVTASRQDTSKFYSEAEKRNVTFLVYRPEQVLKYPDADYPICYFLGSESEVADENHTLRLISNGTLPEYLYLGNDVPAIVISPQHISAEWNTSMIDEAVAYGNSTFPADPKKVYLTGIGEGAYACWQYAKNYSSKITAIAPISGKTNTENSCNLKEVAVWAFHNGTDYVYSSEYTTDMIASINNCGPSNEVKKLFFPDPGHDCWKRVYDDAHDEWSKSPSVERIDLFSWFLSQSK